MKTSVLLKKSLKLFRDGDGWIKGKLSGKARDGKTGYCAIGVIITAGRHYPDAKSNAKYELSSAIKFCSSIAKFNDAPERRFRDVARKFRKAIRACEAKGD